MNSAAKQKLGWREWLALPQLGVSGIKAKVDTGARSSSLHAHDVELFERDGVRLVAFSLELAQVALVREDSRIELPLHDVRWITSSNGTRQKRPIVLTEIDLAGQRWWIELSLGPRGSMGFPMLLGREAIRRRFVVDPGKSFLAKEHLPKERMARRRKAR